MRPIIDLIDNFDAKNGISVKFTYAGNASFGSELRVYKTSDFSKTVYTNRVSSMNYKNSIEPNSLSNNNQYAMEIISYDEYGNASEVSNKIYFWCLSTPVFYFSNISDGDIINEQSITAELYFNQAEDVEISQFKYALYDSQVSLISESEYYSNYEEHSSFTFNGLENNAIYYVRAYGLTTKNQILDTNYISIFMQFESPTNYSVLYADSDNGNGVIEYNTNIKLIEPQRDRLSYKYDSGFIDLENDNLIYDTNFVIDDNFIMAVRHRYALGEILKCSNPDGRSFSLSIVKCENTDIVDGMTTDKCRYKLLVPNDICEYILYSDEFDMNEYRLMTCWIRRIDNLYELTVFSENDNPEEYNLFLGQIRPVNDLARYDVWIDEDYSPTIRIEKEDVVIWKQLEEPTDGLQVNDIWIDIEIEEEE